MHSLRPRLPSLQNYPRNTFESTVQPEDSHLVSDFSVAIHDGVLLSPCVDGEVEQQRRVETRAAGETFDLQNAFPLAALAVELLHGVVERRHLDGAWELSLGGVCRDAVLLDPNAEAVLLRYPLRAWPDAVFPDNRLFVLIFAL